ncbi:MAG: hypothetical protein FRX49_05484 [Trebouxia sp. A1-2]|nr:MAG: hypothetical protein FRX49_05484 [Trebouxia sp. A1-2]
MQVALVGQAKYVSYELQAVCVLTAQIPHHPATLTKMLSMYTINLKQSVVRGEDLSLAREVPMPNCSRASAHSLWAHMLPRLNSDILRGLVPSAAAAATPRGVEGCGALITSTSAYSHCVNVGSRGWQRASTSSSQHLNKCAEARASGAERPVGVPARQGSVSKSPGGGGASWGEPPGGTSSTNNADKASAVAAAVTWFGASCLIICVNLAWGMLTALPAACKLVWWPAAPLARAAKHSIAKAPCCESAASVSTWTDIHTTI